jgi:hypothetical protein
MENYRMRKFVESMPSRGCYVDPYRMHESQSLDPTLFLSEEVQSDDRNYTKIYNISPRFLYQTAKNACMSGADVYIRSMNGSISVRITDVLKSVFRNRQPRSFWITLSDLYAERPDLRESLKLEVAESHE